MAIPTRTLVQLASMGLSAEQAEAVAIMLREVEDATKAEHAAPMEARRAADRRRKAEERERVQIASRHVTSAEVTSRHGTSAEVRGQADDAVFVEESGTPPSPPKGGTSPSPTKPRKPLKPVGVLCPEDLRPAETHYLKCQQRGAPREIADRACETMVNWSNGNAHKDVAYKTDWHRALHRFVDDEIEKWRRDPSVTAGGHPRAPPGQRLSGPTAAALARRTPQDRPDEPALDLAPAPVLRPFPSRRDPPPADLAGRGDEPDDGDPGDAPDRWGPALGLPVRRLHG